MFAPTLSHGIEVNEELGVHVIEYSLKNCVYQVSLIVYFIFSNLFKILTLNFQLKGLCCVFQFSFNSKQIFTPHNDDISYNPTITPKDGGSVCHYAHA